MGKKMIGIAVAAIMLFGIFGLMGCENNSLTTYKEEANARIEAHAATKIEEEYSSANWTAICIAAVEGRAAADKASSKKEIEQAVQSAIEAMDAILPEPVDWMAGVEIVKVIYITGEMETFFVDSFWMDKVEVTIAFPREVTKGDAFSITITTKNITNEDIEYALPSTDEERGYLGVRATVRLQSEFITSLESGYSGVDGERYSQITVGNSVEHTMEFQTEMSPKGIYEICLSHGEIYKNAINII